MKTPTRKLLKMSSHSYALVIPKEFVEKYDWKEHQKFTVKDKGRGLLEIKDWRRR